jgi:hypothetical protein
MATKKYYKIIRSDGTGGYTTFVWPLPENGKPGKWVSVKGPLELCRNGLHVTTAKSLGTWYKDLYDNKVYVVETGKQVIHSKEKSCFRKIRLLEQVPNAKVFAMIMQHSGTRARVWVAASYTYGRITVPNQGQGA